MGRPTKLTPDVQATIVEAIAKGNDKVVAARLAGIGESTFYAWMERGEQAKTGAFLEFREAVKKAEAEAEQHFVGIIKTASYDTWTAAAWWLERKHPERWGRRERIEHTGANGEPVQMQHEHKFDLSGLTDDQLESLETILHRLTDAGPGEAGESAA